MEELNRNKYDSDQHCINSGLVRDGLKRKITRRTTGARGYKFELSQIIF